MVNRIIKNVISKEIGKCEQCVAFHPKAWFGLVPAYCMVEGRILNQYVSLSPFNHVPSLYHEIPYWCPLSKVEEVK